MKWRIKHKTEGWTGTAECWDERLKADSSHTISWEMHWFITQDAYKPDGTYVEDPCITTLDDLEFIERIS